MVSLSSTSHSRNTSQRETNDVLARLQFSDADPVSRAPESSTCQFNGRRYASCSEAIIGALLERFVPGFTVVPGSTFQVPAHRSTDTRTCFIDFKIDGVFFEYHPPRIFASRGRWGDFPSKGAHDKFRRRLDMASSRSERRRIKAEGKEIAGQAYLEKRLRALDRNPELRGTELIVAHNPGEFYERVLCRFAPHPPSKAVFDALYEQLKHEIFRNNPAYWNAHPMRRFDTQNRSTSEHTFTNLDRRLPPAA